MGHKTHSLKRSLGIGLLAALLSPMAAAQVSYHQITGVETGDVLNIRSAPSPGADIIGGLKPGEAPVEVLQMQDGWAEIVAGGQPGWISTTYLQDYKLSRFPDTSLPEELICAGTEPFWSFAPGHDVAFLETGAVQQNPSVTLMAPSQNDRTITRLELGETGDITILQTSCSDGMSDANYGWSAILHLTEDNRSEVFSGCCRVPTQIIWPD